MKTILSRFGAWLSTDVVEQKWAEVSAIPLTKVRLEFANGLVRELTGEDAMKWRRSLHDVLYGRRTEWPKPEQWRTISS